jgi:hypothetical protein
MIRPYLSQQRKVHPDQKIELYKKLKIRMSFGNNSPQNHSTCCWQGITSKFIFICNGLVFFISNFEGVFLLFYDGHEIG